MEQPKKRQIAVIALVVVLVAGVWAYKRVSSKGSAPGNIQTDGAVAYTLTSLDLAALKAYHLPIVLAFTGEGCVACAKMEPALQQMHQTYNGKAIVTTVDVWAHPEAVGAFPGQLIPTLFFFNADGTPYQPRRIVPGLSLSYEKDSAGTVLYTYYEGVMDPSVLQQIIEDMLHV